MTSAGFASLPLGLGGRFVGWEVRSSWAVEHGDDARMIIGQTLTNAVPS